LHFERTNGDLTPGMFRAVGNVVEVMPVNEAIIYRLSPQNGKIAHITRVDAISRSVIDEPEVFYLFPAKHYITPEDEREGAIQDIEHELAAQLKKFEAEGKILEAERLKRRTNYDIALIREIGYCNGIENYSRHFDRRAPGEAPYTLLDYFPHQADGTPDFLTVIDESHVTVPQIGGMYNGDQARKQNLVAYGFRLPSAKDNRPLTFEEFEKRVGVRIYTTATPGTYELEHSGKPVEQIIRPTGLIDPEIIIRPVTGSSDKKHEGQVDDLISETEKVVKGGGRVLTTTLTKKMAEDLSEFLKERGIKAEYIHSDVKTIDRINILTEFRRGIFDCLVGVNLLREGLDLPEVELVGILDADKEGFLRSETSLIQTMGRAARNVKGRVILYADQMTGSLTRAIDETNRRREKQLAYNKKHGITPKTILKNIKDITETLRSEQDKAATMLLAIDMVAADGPKALKTLIKDKRAQMEEVVERLDFETAAILRDEINKLEERLPTPKKPARKVRPKMKYLDSD
jgi:excinuclease ABC subunit B